MRVTRAVFCRVVGSAVATAVVVGTAALGPISPAQADELLPGPAPVEQRPESAVTADELPTVQIDNGVVWSQAIVGNTVFAGGDFKQTRPAGAARGQNLTPRSNILAYDIRTGDLITGFAPEVNGVVKVVRATPDGTRLYIGGTFTQVNGQPRSNLAAVDTKTGQLLPDFSATIGGSFVNGLAATDEYVYVGGDFSKANGVTRTNLAAFDRSGNLRSWAPTTDRQVDCMVMAPKGDRVIIGGRFGRVNNANAIGSAAIDANSGASLPWAITQVVRNGNNTISGTWGLSTDGTNIYGALWSYGGGNYEGVWSAKPDTGEIVWLGNGEGDEYDVYSDGNTVYEVGHSHMQSMIGGWDNYATPSGPHQNSVAFTAQAKGRSTAGGYVSFAGQPAPAIVNWLPRWISGSYTGQGQAGWSITGNGDYVVIGGEFPGVNGSAAYGLTRFAKPALSINKSGPRETGTAWATPSFTASPGGGRVSIRTNWDRDDLNITYELLRSGTAEPVARTTVPSTFWGRGTATMVDTSAEPGKTYTYQVRAVDGDGNSALSGTVNGTASTLPVPAYAKAVIADGASLYWRLGGSASQAAVDWAGSSDGTVSGGVSNATNGAFDGDTSVNGVGSAFSGTTTGLIASRSTPSVTQTSTMETWVRTSTTKGGELLGLGSAASGASGNLYRVLYMGDNGKINFGLNVNGTKTVVTSRAAYNDGEWHHVVASVGEKGMNLYIDGGLVGINSAVTSAGTTTGYWRAGGDSLTGWANKPTSDYLAGDLDEIAIYPKALTKGQAMAHFAFGRTAEDAGGITGGDVETSGSVTQPGVGALDPGKELTVPSDGYGNAVYQSEPDVFWRFEDPAGSSFVADSSANNTPGKVINTIGLGADGALGSKGTRHTGTLSSVVSPVQMNAPKSYTISAWFSTKSTTGGRIIGMANNPNGYSGGYDRQVYVRSDGKLTFFVYPGVARMLTTPAAYNDGAWHQVVATQGSDGMKIYVDGALVASDASTTTAQNISGYWKVGADYVWTGAGTSALTGSIDEATAYQRVLPAAEVSRLYQTATREIVPPTAVATSTATGYTATFDASASTAGAGRTLASYAWDFGDGTTGTGVKPSHTYTKPGTYRAVVTVTDNTGATAVAKTTLQLNYYAVAVRRSAPDMFWQFEDAPGSSSVADSSGNNAVGKVINDPGLGTQGALPGTSGLGLTGTLSSVVSPVQMNAPKSYTISAWFSTKSTTGGRIIGMANNPNGYSGGYDRQVYVRSDGKLTFFVYPGVARMLTTPAAYNDGAWHQVVATQGSDGMKIYVDGALVASDASTTTAQNISGYWKVGADYVWTGAGTSALTGSIDDAAAYQRVLPASEIADLYQASRTPVIPPTAAYSFQTSGYTATFDASASTAGVGRTLASYAWDFGDGTTGTGIKPSHTYTKPGTFPVTLTVTDSDGSVGRVTTSVKLNYYAIAVKQSRPDVFWQFEEGIGATSAADSSTNGATGRVIGNPGFGGDGARTGMSGLSQTGVSGAVVSPMQMNAPKSYTISAWFSTKSTVGGRIIGMANNLTGNSGGYDREVYVRSDGKLTFFVNPGAAKVLTTPAAYNDGAWHQVVATQGGDGMKIYVDGALVASDASTTTAQNISGYWKVGTDNVWSGTATAYLTGGIDDAAAYQRVLSANEIANLYAVSQGAIPPIAAFTSKVAGSRVAFDASTTQVGQGKSVQSYFWDFGDDTTGTGVTPSHTYTEVGDFPVTLTVTDSAGLVSQVRHTVTIAPPHADPKAVIIASQQGLTTDFDATKSVIDPETTVSEYLWNFGDGETSTQAKVSHRYAAAGNYRVTLTVTDALGSSGTATKDINVSGTIAADAFERTGSWGTADVGGAWKTDGGLTVDGGAGLVVLPSPGQTRNAYLTEVSARDVDAQVDMTLVKRAEGGSTMPSLVVRHTNAGDYRAKLVVGTNGSVSVNITKNTAAGEGFVKSAIMPDYTYAAGDVLSVRMQAVTTDGLTALKVKVWRADTTEPTAWFITGTDSESVLQSAGQIGISAYLSGAATNSPQTIRIDNLLVVAP